MNKKIVAVDMDDTICHLVKRAIYHNNKDYPTHPLDYETMFDWNTDHLRHPECTQDVFFGRPGLYEELELFDEHVLGEMEKIHNQHDLIIVTAARASAVVEKWNWLQKHMPFIPYKNFFACKRKDLINFDLLIDDGPHNIVPTLMKQKQVICIPHPWNQEFRKLIPNLIVKNDWQGMSDLVNRILEGK